MNNSNDAALIHNTQFQRFHFHRISSTNDYARELLRDKSHVIVTSDFQWQGRGRNQTNWVGEHGENVYCSFGIRHRTSPPLGALIAFQAAGCLAAMTAIQQHAEKIELRLKYPNDIYAELPEGGWRKLCGVLVEHEFLGSACVSTVLGVGININQRSFGSALSHKAASLHQLGYSVDIDHIAESLIQNISFLLTRSASNLMQAWKQELDIVGRRVSLLADGSDWNVLDMLTDGRLHLRSAEGDGERFIDNGDSILYDLQPGSARS